MIPVLLVESGCWRWLGPYTGTGYGRVRSTGVDVLAHRAVYEWLVGPIPEGLELDHVKEAGCRYLDCCNPAHLEPVTHAENVRRGDSPGMIARRAGTCTRGHPATESYRRKGTDLVVYCRACRREDRRAARAAA